MKKEKGIQSELKINHRFMRHGAPSRQTKKSHFVDVFNIKLPFNYKVFVYCFNFLFNKCSEDMDQFNPNSSYILYQKKNPLILISYHLLACGFFLIFLSTFKK